MTSERKDIACPCCHQLLFHIYTEKDRLKGYSKTFAEDEHGKFLICENPQCRRKIRMVEPGGIVVPAAQDCS